MSQFLAVGFGTRRMGRPLARRTFTDCINSTTSMASGCDCEHGLFSLKSKRRPLDLFGFRDPIPTTRLPIARGISAQRDHRQSVGKPLHPEGIGLEGILFGSRREIDIRMCRAKPATMRFNRRMISKSESFGTLRLSSATARSNLFFGMRRLNSFCLAGSSWAK